VKNCHILPNLVLNKKRKEKEMAKNKSKDTGLVREIQKVLLDDADFLRILVQENLQKILETEFAN